MSPKTPSAWRASGGFCLALAWVMIFLQGVLLNLMASGHPHENFATRAWTAERAVEVYARLIPTLAAVALAGLAMLRGTGWTRMIAGAMGLAVILVALVFTAALA